MSPAIFQQLVDRYYPALYRFGLSLSGNTEAASDLVQQTFFLLAQKGHQLRDIARAKGWLFTTLYREYLTTHRRTAKFPEVELTEAVETPTQDPEAYDALDGDAVMAALSQLEEVYRAPLTLFYLEELSYKEIAEVLDVPIGTVMSRLSRGKEQLRKRLADSLTAQSDKVVPFQKQSGGNA